MDQQLLEEGLAGIYLGGIRYFEQIGSTNDEAADWVRNGAPDLSLVIADEQTAGRGRGSRKWLTYPKSALAISLIFRPSKIEKQASSDLIPRFTGLSALGVCYALQKSFGLHAEIKWPNDILLGGRKCCGILVEAQWKGDQLASLILGIGINVAPSSVPPEDVLSYPATSIETICSEKVDRIELLHSVLAEIIHLRTNLMTDAFIHAWDTKLAFRGKWVQIVSSGQVPKLLHEGQLFGLSPDGALNLRTISGDKAVVRFGEIPLDSGQIHLRQVDSLSK